MAGAIAGTALFNLRETEGIDVVTLTVNNICNMKCPHCYLQYDGKKDYISSDVVDILTESDFRHLAIVGAEPLFNRDHAMKTSGLIERMANSGKTVSLITNSINLDYLDSEHLKFVDVSFDGGPETYSLFRKADYKDVVRKISDSKIKKFNALHTIYSENSENIDDMVRINNDANFGIMLFSPYLETKNEGTNFVSPIALNSLLEKLIDSKEFMDAKNTLLNIDIFHAKQYGLSMDAVKSLVEDYGLEQKTKLFETDLLDKGVVRVTYDGLVMSPEQSLHTANYKEAICLDGSLENAYRRLLDPVEAS